MKKYFIAMVLGLVIGASAQASEGKTVVVCTGTHFDDLTKIEIQETDLKGQYLIIETLYDSVIKEEKYRYSPVFSMAEIEKSEFPELSPWVSNYTRKLIRDADGTYGIVLSDECTTNYNSLTCKESF